ncbi:MAG TPA: hypothetical protein VLC47_07915 [Burkholderiales bacterium]|nr:hypothetical protein [Burkholderiales bacterium]
MSPSWRDRVEVFLAPDRVDFTHFRRGLRPQAGLTHSQPCEARGDADWRAAVDAVARALAALAWRNADAHVTLSNHFVRLALVPRIDEAARGAERLALAQHQLRLMYGERADGWEVVVGEPAGSAAVAAGIDPELLAALRATFAAARIELVALRPFLAAAYNSARTLLVRGPAWLAVAERGRVCVAHLDGARWLALRSQRVQGALEAALPLALEQCRLANGIDAEGAEVCVITRDPLADEIAPAGRWRFRAIPARAAAAREASA